jgi:AbrB family looped-hinge helix DNA binding protein
METIKTSSKGQIVIPKAIREALDIRSGTELSVELLPGEGFKVTVERAGHAAKVQALAGSLAKYATAGGAKSDEEALLRAVREDDARIRGYAARARPKKRK